MYSTTTITTHQMECLRPNTSWVQHPLEIITRMQHNSPTMATVAATGIPWSNHRTVHLGNSNSSMLAATVTVTAMDNPICISHHHHHHPNNSNRSMQETYTSISPCMGQWTDQQSTRMGVLTWRPMAATLMLR